MVSKLQWAFTLTTCGKDSISEAFWARVSRLTSWDTLRFLRVLWMTPVGAAWMSRAPFWEPCSPGAAWSVEPGRKGLSDGAPPSLESRRDLRSCVWDWSCVWGCDWDRGSAWRGGCRGSDDCWGSGVMSWMTGSWIFGGAGAEDSWECTTTGCGWGWGCAFCAPG